MQSRLGFAAPRKSPQRIAAIVARFWKMFSVVSKNRGDEEQGS
jgi:hypothetical protein